MQSTILFLQQELKTTRDRILTLEKENFQLKTGSLDNENTIKVADAEVTDANISALHSSHNGAVAPCNITVNVAETCAIPYNTNATTINNASSTALPLTHNTLNNANELKYAAPRPLETIDENSCLRNYGTPNDFYNGNEEQPHVPIAVGKPMLEADGNNTLNPFITASPVVAGGAMLRTVASRKRNYDCSELNDSPAVITPATPTHVIAPRTLPPKKSKLRRTSVQSNEINEYDAGNCLGSNNAQQQMLGGINTVIAAVDPLSIVDNAVVGMANEEHTSGLAIDESAMDVGGNNGGVALRIMTRRRSVRQQQNGNIGGDSNH